MRDTHQLDGDNLNTCWNLQPELHDGFPVQDLEEELVVLAQVELGVLVVVVVDHC